MARGSFREDSGVNGNLGKYVSTRYRRHLNERTHMALEHPSERFGLLRRRPPKVDSSRRVAGSITVLPTRIAESNHESRNAKGRKPNVLEVGSSAIDHSGGELLRRVVRQGSVGAGRRDILVRQTHEVLVLLPKLSEPRRRLVLRNVVSFHELSL